MNIGFMGIGKLGACFTACLAYPGNNIMVWDIDIDKTVKMGRGEAPVEETNLQKLMDKNKERIFPVFDTETLVKDSDLTFICVPTPSRTDDNFSNHYIKKALEVLALHLKNSNKEYHIINIISTVSPGAFSGELIPFMEKLSGRDFNVGFGMCYNPWFIALGSVVDNFLNPSHIILGSDKKEDGDVLEKIFIDMCKTKPAIYRLNIVETEISKISANTFSTLKLSLANILTNICEKFYSADVDKVNQAITGDKRFSPLFFKGGLSFGGPCLKPGTKVLSNPKFMQIENSENVLSKKGVKQKVLKHFKTPFDGNLVQVKIKGSCQEISLTPDHLVWVDNSGYKEFGDVHQRKYDFTGWKPAKNLRVKDLVSIPRPVFKDDLEKDENYLKICGWYLSEENAEKYRISIRQKSEETIQEIAKLSDRSSIIEDSQGFKVRIYGKKITEEMMRDFGSGSKNKKLPEWIFYLKEDLKLIFLKAYLRGDGSWTDRLSSFTSSETLKDDLIILYFNLGYYPSVSYQEKEKTYNGYSWMSSGWRISLSNRDGKEFLDKIGVSAPFNGSRKQYAKRENEFLVPICQISDEYYSGSVFNIETEDETYSVPFRVHNCLPRDTRAFSALCRDIGIEPLLTDAAEKMNINQDLFLYNKIKDWLWNFDVNVVILGLSYKKGVPHIIESSSEHVINMLIDDDAKIIVYDTKAMEQAKKKWGTKVLYANSVEDCFEEPCVCVVAIPDEEFFDLTKIKKGSIIIDCWRVVEKYPEDVNIDLLGVGQ